MSVACFLVGSIVAALAHDVVQILIGRVIQGIGGGGIVCLTVRNTRRSVRDTEVRHADTIQYVIVTDIIPLQQRAAFLAIPQLAWAIGTIIGPLLGASFLGL